MSILRPNGPFRVLILVAAIVVIATTATGCAQIDAFLNPDDSGQDRDVVESVSYGNCLPTYGSRVSSAGVSLDGSRLLYLSSTKPGNWDDDRGWGRSDKALYLRESGLTRYIATTWPAVDEIPQYSTPESADDPPGAEPLDEDMVYAWLSGAGDRFLVAVGRVGVTGLFAKLYSGAIPAEGSHELRPDNGLALVKVNDFVGTEGIDSVAFSPDGSKVAVTVGAAGEVRIFNLDADELTVYTRGEDGETVIENVLPSAQTSITDSRQPAIQRVKELAWSPDGARLALSFETGVGSTALGLLDIATGDVVTVRGFADSTLPHVVWHTDGRSLFAMTTKLVHGTVFGDTEIRHLAAAEDGREISPGGQLRRPLGFRTEPAWLVGNGDNEQFFFTWDGVVYRLTAPASEPAKSSYLPVSSDKYVVTGRGLTVSPATERLVFVAVGNSSMVGERTHALANDCPLDAVAPAALPDESAGEGAAEEPEATDEAAEGEAAEGEVEGADTAGEDEAADNATEGESEAADEAAEEGEGDETAGEDEGTESDEG